MCPLPLLFMWATFVKFTVAGHSLPPEKKKKLPSPPFSHPIWCLLYLVEARL